MSAWLHPPGEGRSSPGVTCRSRCTRQSDVGQVGRRVSGSGTQHLASIASPCGKKDLHDEAILSLGPAAPVQTKRVREGHGAPPTLSPYRGIATKDVKHFVFNDSVTNSIPFRRELRTASRQTVAPANVFKRTGCQRHVVDVEEALDDVAVLGQITVPALRG